MHHPTGALHRRRIAFQIKIQMRDRVILDRHRRVPQRLEFRQCLNRGPAFFDEHRLGLRHRLLQPGIGHRRGRVLLEGVAGGLHDFFSVLTKR